MRRKQNKTIFAGHFRGMLRKMFAKTAVKQPRTDQLHTLNKRHRERSLAIRLGIATLSIFGLGSDTGIRAGR